MQYTKGEWKDTLSATGERVIFVDTEGVIEIICRDVRHWNRQIIKAAPDMYESLKEIRQLIKIYSPQSKMGRDIRLLIQKVFAKAEMKNEKI